MTPTNEYTTYRVRVLYETESYEKARLKLKQAEVTSDLQTEAEEDISQPKRKKRPNPRYEALDSSSEEDEPQKDSVTVSRIRISPRKKTVGHSFPVLPLLPSPPTLSKSQSSSPAGPSTSTPKEKTVTVARTPVHYSSPPARPSSSRQESTCSVSLFDSTSKPKVSAFDTKVLTGIEELKQQVRINTRYLQAILKKLETEQVSTVDCRDELPENIILPLQTKNQVLELDEQLKDENLQKQLVSRLALLGGDSVKSCVRRVLDYLFSKAAALSFNWVGRNKDKIGFQTLTLSITLKKAVRKNRLFSSSTDQEIESVAKDWFRYARDRNGGRKERGIKKMNKTTGSMEEKEKEDSENEHFSD